MAYNFTEGETEILILKAIVDSIDDMVNNEILSVHHNDPYSEVRFKSITAQQYFNILLLDLLNSRIRILQVDENCLNALQKRIYNLQFGTAFELLKNTNTDFFKWLESEVNFENNNQIRKLWFPSINT